MDPKLQQEIKDMINSSKVFLFMKGTPDEPQCGFSFHVVKILKELGTQFNACNILEDPELRQAIKEYSNWPTYPQLYVNNKLVGGCDIITQLHESGELKTLLEQ